jgi:hypothetical protein
MKKPIFLSASVPYRKPFSEYFDAIAIREAVLALVAVTVRERELVFGGHPAISPLVEHAARSLGALERVHIYQSDYFADKIPAVAKEFPNLHWTEKRGTGESAMSESLTHMRNEMIGSRKYCAAVFIGGMEGLFEELEIFKQRHPASKVWPIGSTGGAANDLLERGEGPTAPGEIEALKRENRYKRLFKRLLS